MTSELALHLKDPRELFVFDPASYDPLAPDDLGESGIEYLLAHTSHPLTSWLHTPHLHATIYVPPDRFAADLAPRLQAALRTHCARQIARSRREQAHSFLQSALRLVVGLGIVLLAITLQVRISASVLPGGDLVKQALQLGIDVLAWVALWTPVEALATDWFSFYRLRRGYRALLGMDLAVKTETPAGEHVGQDVRFVWT
jgi:hypothetical protein